MSDNTKYDDEKVLSLRELLEQDDPGAITKSNLSYCLDIITELKDENESLWFMLEEQKNVKTDNIMEELILYTFLGVFVIFVVDSFARAGKYTR